MFNKNQSCSAVKTNGSHLSTKYRLNNYVSIFPLHIRKHCIITPIKSILPDSSKRINQDKKRPIEHALCQSKTKCFSASNFYTSNKVTISSINDKENNVLSLLNKLPDITLGLVKSDTSVKAPKTLSKHVEKKSRTIITSEVVLNRKVLSKKQCPNTAPKNYPLYAKNENIQIIKNKNMIKPKSFISTKLKTPKSTINACKILQKPNNFAKNEDYTLMDLSINGQINIVQATNNIGFSKYEVIKSTEDINNQNDTAVKSSSSGQEVTTHLSELSGYNIFLHFSDIINLQN